MNANPWRQLSDEESTRYMCSSTNCDDMAETHLVEAGGVGSYYCIACAVRINRVLRKPTSDLTQTPKSDETKN